jgi:DNA-binding MarR family transcriptional regulator
LYHERFVARIICVKMLGGDRPPEALGQYTGFLLNWVGARSRARFGAALADIGLHPREFGVLTIIAERPAITQQEIVDATQVDSSTMVATLDAFEERGLATRRVHPEDRRKRTVHLTPQGQKLLARATELAGVVGDETFAPLTGAERRQLRALLRKLAGLD